MKNVLILHGTDINKEGNNKDGNWFPWLKEELEKAGYIVYLPELPMPWEPNIERYWDFLSKNFNFNKESIILGHSSGGTSILGILNKLPDDKKIKMAVLVAAFMWDEGWNCEGLFSEKFDWDKIRRSVSKIVMFYSDDDPYVSIKQSSALIDALNPSVFKMHNKKHLSQGTIGGKRNEFPELLDLINTESK